MVIAYYKSKSALKAASRVVDKHTKEVVREGQVLCYRDPSYIGQGDYKHTGTFAVVGPSELDRRWYATVTLQDGYIISVK